MTDRELLEMAAKAAGIPVEWDGDGFVRPVPFKGFTNYEPWNPLTDDGDALRLAANRNISIEWFDTIAGDYVEAQVHWGDFECVRESLIGRKDNEAVRRAIVRAAAEIGKAMP